eukprot:6397730-Pyramimonas_sp.AAC.1
MGLRRRSASNAAAGSPPIDTTRAYRLFMCSPTSPLGAGGLERFLFQPPFFPCSGSLPPPPSP